MTTENGQNARVSGIHELARQHLAVLCDQFLYAEPARVASAWEQGKMLDPDDISDSHEGPMRMYLDVLEDLGNEIAGEDGRMAGCFSSFVPLLSAYGENWPRDGLKDYLLIFEGYDKDDAEATAERLWKNARARYDQIKSLDGKPKRQDS